MPQRSQRLHLSHDLSGIPKGFQVTIGVVSEGREIIESDPATPGKIQETILPMMAGARNFLVASSTLVPEKQIAVAQEVRESGSLQTVTTPRIVQELRRKSYALKDESLRSRIPP
jgi:predicted transcriptional regulator